MAEAPSGQQFEIRHDSQRAVVVEVGAGLRAYEVDGARVIDGYPEEEMVSGGRGAILAPWPNRLAGGGYELDGQRYQLALTEPDRHNAIHGLVRWANWTCAEHGPDRVCMALKLHPQPGYPFRLDFTVEYMLNDQGLRVNTTAKNRAEQRAPYGIGHHPYLAGGSDRVDECRLLLPAASHLELNDHAVPTG